MINVRSYFFMFCLATIFTMQATPAYSEQQKAQSNLEMPYHSLSYVPVVTHDNSISSNQGFFNVDKPGYYSIDLAMDIFCFPGGSVTIEFYDQAKGSVGLLSSIGLEPTQSDIPTLNKIDDNIVNFFSGKSSVFIIVKAKNAVVFSPQAKFAFVRALSVQ